MSPQPKLEVRLGLGTLDRRMTKDQAQRYGERNMPRDLKRAGFSTTIFTANVDDNGWSGYRINYGK